MAEQREIAQLCILSCPVRTECLSYALKADERWGVWGGTTEPERRTAARAMREHEAPAEHVAELIVAEQDKRYSIADLQTGRQPRPLPLEPLDEPERKPERETDPESLSASTAAEPARARSPGQAVGGTARITSPSWPVGSATPPTAAAEPSPAGSATGTAATTVARPPLPDGLVAPTKAG